MNQYFNSAQFFKCNNLVTENCIFVSFIDFHLSILSAIDFRCELMLAKLVWRLTNGIYVESTSTEYCGKSVRNKLMVVLP